MVTRPKYSVLIPTRERAETLRYCLLAFADIDYTDFEIVIGDNCSSEATKRVVDELALPNVKYFRYERPVSMASSFELTWQQASGEWIISIGDDDALLRDVFKCADAVIAQTNTKLMRWDNATYTWPNPSIPEHSDYLRIPLVKKEGKICSSREGLKQMMNSPNLYPYVLAGCYHGVVHRSLFEQIHRVMGRAFIGSCPDVINAIGASFFADTFASLSFPLSVAGHSAKSNGGNMLVENDHIREFYALNGADQFASHPWMRNITGHAVGNILETVLLARDQFFPNDPELTVERANVLRYLVTSFRPAEPERWAVFHQQMRDSVADSPPLQSFVEDLLASTPQEVYPPFGTARSPKGIGFLDGALHLDASQFGVYNICDVAKLCSNIVGTPR